MRLDKFLCEMNIGTRSEVKQIIQKGQVTVNDTIVKKSDSKIDENNDIIKLQGKELSYKKFGYYILNKPEGVVTATNDNLSKTVMDLMPGELRKNYFPVGRLDKDTTGLLLITNDGELAHYMLSPKKHVDKTYLVGVEQPLSREAYDKLSAGVDIGEEKLTEPATVKILSDDFIELTIHEGKFHQVKRMLSVVDNRVVSLKRISFGPLRLDDNLDEGCFRELTDEEINKLNVR